MFLTSRRQFFRIDNLCGKFIPSGFLDASPNNGKRTSETIKYVEFDAFISNKRQQQGRDRNMPTSRDQSRAIRTSSYNATKNGEEHTYKLGIRRDQGIRLRGEKNMSGTACRGKTDGGDEDAN